MPCRPAVIRSGAAGPRLLAAALLALGGCAATPEVEHNTAVPLQFRTVAAAPAVLDRRAAFRGTFCSTLRAGLVASSDDASCDRWLWRLRDEPAAGLAAVMTPLAPGRVELILVTGAFSECVGERSRPFAAAADRLQASGARVRTVTVVAARAPATTRARSRTRC